MSESVRKYIYTSTTLTLCRKPPPLQYLGAALHSARFHSSKTAVVGSRPPYQSASNGEHNWPSLQPSRGGQCALSCFLVMSTAATRHSFSRCTLRCCYCCYPWRSHQLSCPLARVSGVVHMHRHPTTTRLVTTRWTTTRRRTLRFRHVSLHDSAYIRSAVVLWLAVAEAPGTIR